MSKYKSTKKAINNQYVNVIKIGYCNLQYLLQYVSPFAYSTRAEGWACDYYHININTVISTGYAPTGNITPKHDIQQKFEEEARQVVLDPNYSNESKKRLVSILLNNFIEEVL